MNTITEQTIKDNQKTKEGYNETLAKCLKLKIALKDYDKQTINKKFFDKYFLIKMEYRDYHEFKISEPQYNFQNGKRIYLSHNQELELTGDKIRDKDYILSVLEDKIKTLTLCLNDTNSQLAKLEAFNEDEFKKDITELYNKYDKPNNWRQLLEDNRYIN